MAFKFYCPQCGHSTYISGSERRQCYECGYDELIVPPSPDIYDGLHTCSICRDRYITNESGVCDSCRQQAWIDEHG